ncbi:MAG: transposase [Candidatus Methylomirabilis sp.]|nr:transposase [Deltaproteobacteria bacterium]
MVRHRFQRDKVSAISAVTVSPRRRRLGLYFQLHPKSVSQREVRAFLRLLLRHLKGAAVVLWDNGGAHKGGDIRALLARVRRLRIEWLPPYAPELNPDEGVWAQAKSALANGAPRDRDEISATLAAALLDLRRSQRRLRACVLQSDLPPFLP